MADVGQIAAIYAEASLQPDPQGYIAAMFLEVGISSEQARGYVSAIFLEVAITSYDEGMEPGLLDPYNSLTRGSRTGTQLLVHRKPRTSP